MKNNKIYKILIYILIIAIIFTNPVSALDSNKDNQRDDLPTEQYVSDTFIMDEELHSEAIQKEQLAMKLYQASMSGNEKLARQYKMQFEQAVNPTLAAAYHNSYSRSVENDTLPSSFRIPDLYQVPQENNYYCGPAAAKSILDNIGIVKSQSFLASDNYLKTNSQRNTPWYMANGNSHSQFPMVMTLRNLQYDEFGSAYGYVPSPMGAAGANPLSTTEVKAYVMATTSAFNDGYGVAACGRSTTAENNQLPGYPNRDVGHWLVSDGYENNGNTIWIVDPAWSEAVSWSDNIDPYYFVSITVFTNFIKTRGIVW